MNWPFSWKAGHARMRSRTSASLAVMPEAGGFRGRGLLLDHLLHDALIDAELLQQLLVDVGAVRLPVGAHLLLVDAPELRHGDLVAVDVGDDGGVCGALGRVAHETGDIEKDEARTTRARLHLSHPRWRRIRSSIVMGSKDLEYQDG